MKGRKHRASGGTDDAAEDLKDKPKNRGAESKVSEEADEMKKGGRAKHAAGGRTARKHGGKTEVGKVDGEKAKHHAGRMPRKSGGRASADMNPFSSARTGKQPAGSKTMSEDD